MRATSSGLRALTLVGTAGAAALTVHSVINARLLRRPVAAPPQPAEGVSVLLPVRDELARIEGCVRAVLAALDACSGPVELVILDDGSTDGTGAVARRIIGEDPRCRVLDGGSLPPGWLGKSFACDQLAANARPDSSVLVFLDADVELDVSAVRAAVDLLRRHDLAIVCPYPRQRAETVGERLVQPLLQWSWLTLLPLRIAERSARGSLSAGNGQLLVVDRATYDRAGGHGAVRADVLEDVALVRAIKAVGGRGGVVDGTGLATCRMYDGWAEVEAGYTKSLWSAFGSPTGAVAANALLWVVYVVPPVAAVLRRSRVGLAGYALGVAGRMITARRTGGRAWPDALAHPASIVAFSWLTARSVRHHRRGGLSWKGRSL